MSQDGISKQQGEAVYYQAPNRESQYYEGQAVKEKDPGIVNLEVERVFLAEEVGNLISKVRKATKAKLEEFSREACKEAYLRGQKAGAALAAQRFAGQAPKGTGSNNV